MTVDELLTQRFYLKIEMEELELHLHNKIACGRMAENEINELLSKLLELREEFQRAQVMLDEANASATIRIGSKEISVAVALRIRDTTKYRIELLSKLLTKGQINGLPLLEQKKKLILEHVLLNSKIDESAKETHIG